MGLDRLRIRDDTRSHRADPPKFLLRILRGKQLERLDGSSVVALLPIIGRDGPESVDAASSAFSIDAGILLPVLARSYPESGRGKFRQLLRDWRIVGRIADDTS